VITNAAGAATSSNATLTVNVPVYIVSQPVSQLVVPGNTANFSVVAGGDAPYVYQWYEISTNRATATPQVLNGFVYGANVTSGGSGYVTVPNVAITGGGGSGALATAVVSNGVVTAVVVTSTGSGYGATPAIQIDPPTRVAMDGETNATFSIDDVTTNDAGDYLVMISNNYGSITSVPAALRINVVGSNVVQNPGAPIMSLAAGVGGFHLTIAGATNTSWVLLSATSLTPPVVWQPVCTNSADGNGNWQFTDTNLNYRQRFYRVVSF